MNNTKFKTFVKIALAIVLMLLAGLFVSIKWNQLWLYDGWPGAWGSPKWLMESDGEGSYDMEFFLMLIWVYGVMLSVVGVILFMKYKKRNTENRN